MAKRYYVSPSDTCGSVENAVRDRQWDVIDRNTGNCVANYDRRVDARKEADELNDSLASEPKRQVAGESHG